MDFAGLNYIAILLAAIVSFLFGGLWYNYFAKAWLAAVGKTEEDIKSDAQPMALLMGIAVVAQLVMAFVLAGVIGHLGAGQVTLHNGLISALMIWAGFVLTTLVVNHGFQGQSRMLTVIDGAHWLGVLLLQGAVIGIMGV